MSISRFFRRHRENTLVDGEVGGRRVEYAHQTSPGEMGVLRAYITGDPDTVELEFFDAHRRDPRRRGARTRALEEVVVYAGGVENERFRQPQNRPFQYTNPEGNTYDSEAHDPVEKAIVAQARSRFGQLSDLYRTLLEQVEQEARRRVSH